MGFYEAKKYFVGSCYKYLSTRFTSDTKASFKFNVFTRNVLFHNIIHILTIHQHCQLSQNKHVRSFVI